MPGASLVMGAAWHVTSGRQAVASDSAGGAPPEAEKRVSWAELFFDLVFVIAVTEVSTLLEHDRSAAGLVRGLVVFVPVYWLWVGTAIQTNQRDISRPLVRLRVFAVALAAVFMALALPDAYDGLGPVFAVAYWIGRVVLGYDLFFVPQQGLRLPLNPFTVSICLTGPLLVVGALVDGLAREVLWAVAALLDLSTPTLFQSRLRGMHFDAAHLAERFGLFVLIAIGESVVAITASAQVGDRLPLSTGSAVAAAFALSAGLWWVYFQFAADAVRHALATAQVQLDITRLVLSYGHLAFIAAIIVVAVGMREAVGHPGDQLSVGLAGLLYGGTAVYLATFGFTRWAMFRLVSSTRLTAAAVVLVLTPAATLVPALAALAVLAVVVAGLNVVEYARVEQIGWANRLVERDRSA
jgi:low temperature requirement protein LtrA